MQNLVGAHSLWGAFILNSISCSFLQAVNFCNSVFLADARYLKVKFDDDGMIMIVDNDTMNQYTLTVTNYETLC